MKLVDYILIVILAVILGSVLLYIRRSRKKGVRCIGCPNGAKCSGSCTGCPHSDNRTAL